MYSCPTMNLPDSVTRLAKKLKLEMVNTGGGMDYPFKEFKPDLFATVGDDIDGTTIDSISKPARITFYKGDFDRCLDGDEEEVEYGYVKYSSTRAAMTALAKMDRKKALDTASKAIKD